MCADDEDGLGGGGQGEEGVAVLQQNDGFFGDVARVIAASERVDDLADGRHVDDAGGEHAADDAVHHVVQTGLGDSAGEDGLLELVAEVDDAGLLHVEAGEGGLLGGVGAVPIGKDEALEVPLLFEDLVQGVVVLTGVGAVDAVVGAHDAGRMSDADGDFEGEEVSFAKGAGGELGVQRVAAGLLGVEDVVLDVAHDVLGLNIVGEAADDEAGEDGVLAGVLEVAAVAGLADEVDAAADGHVVALVAELAADNGAVEGGGFRVPGGGEADDGGKEGGVAALAGGSAGAYGGVCEIDVGQAQAGNARDETGTAVVRGSDGRAGAEDAPAIAVDELDLFVEGHGLDHELGAAVGAEGGIGPRFWGGLGEENGGGQEQESKGQSAHDRFL